MTPLIRGMVPLQSTRGPLERDAGADALAGDLTDPQRNAQAVRALACFRDADLVGICEAEPWMRCSHDETEGRPIEPYHRYAGAMLIGQGFETMEAASGDDWISGAQSMRAYVCGALIAGVMAVHLRCLGHSARAHSDARSEALQPAGGTTTTTVVPVDRPAGLAAYAAAESPTAAPRRRAGGDWRRAADQGGRLRPLAAAETRSACRA